MGCAGSIGSSDRKGLARLLVKTVNPSKTDPPHLSFREDSPA
ncbi:hypothetical protein RBWH47_06046 [Rhodopirellula baltica WH47]|uniref:Uncharacterized protein n=1 Tax=Rhodopirellula baltica WH47 TaxID=991778 RepID=F2AWY2_RHOBT|nr:hypothetical protein RBWH47_06046 [Rhodopirellula baltica WH47]